MFDTAREEGVDMAKQLIELRCGSIVMPYVKSSHKHACKFLRCTEVPHPLSRTTCTCHRVLIN